MANPISERPLPALIDDLANAIRAKDVNAVMTYYAPDVLAFDLLPPLQYRGADAIRTDCRSGFLSFEGPISFEMRGLEISPRTGTLPSATASMGSAERIQVEKESKCGGARRLASARSTVSGSSRMGIAPSPFDMRSGKALLDLKP